MSLRLRIKYLFFWFKLLSFTETGEIPPSSSWACVLGTEVYRHGDPSWDPVEVWTGFVCVKGGTGEEGRIQSGGRSEIPPSTLVPYRSRPTRPVPTEGRPDGTTQPSSHYPSGSRDSSRAYSPSRFQTVPDPTILPRQVSCMTFLWVLFSVNWFP